MKRSPEEMREYWQEVFREPEGTLTWLMQEYGQYWMTCPLGVHHPQVAEECLALSPEDLQNKRYPPRIREVVKLGLQFGEIMVDYEVPNHVRYRAARRLYHRIRDWKDESAKEVTG